MAVPAFLPTVLPIAELSVGPDRHAKYTTPLRRLHFPVTILFICLSVEEKRRIPLHKQDKKFTLLPDVEQVHSDMRLSLLLVTIAIGCLAISPIEAFDQHVRRNVERARSKTRNDQQVGKRKEPTDRYA